MNFSKYDIEIIDRITPFHFKSYLREHGWRITEEIMDKAIILEKDGMVALVPLRVELKDYTSRIYDLIQNLLDVENRPLEAIITDLLNTDTDILRITAFKGDAQASLPLEDAAKLIQRSLDLVSAVAQSIVNPRPVFQSRRHKLVDDFLAQLRMGHTEKGSFTVTLQAPVSPRFDIKIPSLFEEEPTVEEEPFARQVMLKLCNVVSMTGEIANKGEIPPESIQKGISANFCEALSDIVEVCGIGGAYLGMSWASVRPVHEKLRVRDSFSIKRATATELKSIGTALRQKAPETNVEIQGLVVLLESEGNDWQQNGGTIEVQDMMTDCPRIVSIKVNPENYAKALKAHTALREIHLNGNLEKSGKSKMLSNASDITIIEC